MIVKLLAGKGSADARGGNEAARQNGPRSVMYSNVHVIVSVVIVVVRANRAATQDACSLMFACTARLILFV